MPSAADTSPPLAESSYKPDQVLHTSVNVTAISQHNNWDTRECAVSNVDQWRQLLFTYTKTTSTKIPRILHQIWIGDREPPCVWIDTWRINYIQGIGKDEGWQHILWDNDRVSKLQMYNQDLFDHETMWQCKADILRLELLWQYGGVYIDSDVISMQKSLESVIQKTEETQTGFAITYEPDTKDKPYSVLGNSVIVASPKHPLVAMLIQYIKTIYHHKRPFFSAEWVTGPLTYTKVLLHTGLNFYIPPNKLFYPGKPSNLSSFIWTVFR